MIELILLEYLNRKLQVSAYMEEPKGASLSSEYVVLEKTGGSETDFVCRSTFAIQSYSDTLYGAAQLNESVKEAMDSITLETEISKAAPEGDYNFTDVTRKKYRYQAVYELVYFRR